jgi:Ca2+-transporting ATPase
MAMTSDSVGSSSTKKAKMNGSTITYRSSSPSSTHLTFDETRGRKPALHYNPPPTLPVSGASGGILAESPEEIDVLASTEGSVRGGVSASPGGGTYAYSTTLRRQPSMPLDAVPFLPHHGHRATSPSPYRKRGASFGTPVGGETSVWGRLVDGARRATGRGGYESLREDDAEERRLSMERRQKETPSAIYAHKSVDVSPALPNTFSACNTV